MLQEMSKTLGMLVDACEGYHRPHCPILDKLEGGPLGRAHRLS
jgi:MerR family transcriptional regulator, gold-responsive activator of gol and ges genes